MTNSGTWMGAPVSSTAGLVTLLAVSPASAYATDGTDTSSDSIDVRFRNGNDDKCRIRVQIDDQGRLVHEIDAG